MSLSKVDSGKKVSVVSMNAGTILMEKLASLGILPGAEIEMIHNSLHGAFVIGCRGSRLVIGRGVAHIIHVKE